MQSDQEFWVLTCKVCWNLHVGQKVNRDNELLNVPFDGKYECPLHPGVVADYQTREWRPMLESRLKGLDKIRDM